jgi:hypothetical protein
LISIFPHAPLTQFFKGINDLLATSSDQYTRRLL